MPAYADGYVAPDGNIYYGYKSDSNYSKERFKIEVHYYSNKEDADNDTLANQDPLGQYVHVKYTANLNDKHEFDKWAFRPMWWYGVPAGLTNVHNINYSRFEKYTNNGKPSAPSTSHGPNQDSDNVTKHYRDAKDWKSISRFYITDPSTLTSKNGLAMLLGVDGKNNSGYDSKGGTTAGNWKDFYEASKGMQGMFVDWESAGKRFYEMDYVAELTENAWKNRDEHPLRFAAGVYRFAGNWHIATGQIHRAPKIADSLKVQYPPLTPVAKADALENTEKTSVENAIKKVNKDVKHFNDLLDKIEVANDGTATLTFHDNTTIKMPGKLLVVEDKKDNVKFPPVYPAPMGVVNPKSLSEADQQAIIKGFKDANKDKDFLKKIKAQDTDAYTFDNNNQTLKINYQDGSSLTIPYDQLVYQGATIADWAPYVVPDAIEVDDLTKLKQDEINKIIKAFDDANKGITPYDEARKGNGDKAPVEVSANGDVTITWKDGSKTTIAAWQFLKQKPKTTPSPEPQPPAPKPAEGKKTFTVEFSDSNKKVVPNFDPFNASSANETTKSAVKAVKKQFTALKAKDSDGKDVTITDVEFDFDNGKVIFKAGESYKDQSYPMPLLFKNGSTGTQNPTQQTPTSKTDTDPNNNKNTYKYFVTKTQISEAKVSDVKPQEVVKALKQFVKDNYTGWTEQDLASVTSNVAVGKNWKAKNGTTNLEPFNNGNGRITSISVSNDNGLTVNGYQYADQEDANIDVSTDGPLFTISADDLYAPNSGSQTPTDNTIENLRKLAKQLRDQRKNAGELADADITTLKATDSDIDGMNDEKALRELIKKIADYQKPKPVEYKYNFEKLTLDHEGDLTDDDYKKIVVEQFLKKNYTTTDNTNWTTLENAYAKNATVLSGNNANTYNLTPVASGTSGLNIYTGDKQAGGVTSVVVDSKTGDLVVRGWKAGSTSTNAEELIRIKKADLYTPKSKEQNPAITPEQLQQMKNDAKKIIDKNPYLTPDQKKQFKDKIDDPKNGPKDQKGIQNILNEAKEQGEKNKQNTSDPNVQNIINNNKGGGDEKDKHELDAAKEAAKKAIDALTHLSNEEKNEFKKQLDGGTVKTPADVQKIVDEAKLADELKGAKDGAQKEKFVFLDHGTGDDKHNTAATHDEDAALNSVLGTKPAEDSTLADLAKKLKEGSNATAAEIRDALDAAKRQNAINEQAAKRAATAKLEALGQALDDAVSKLSEADKTAVNEKVQAVKTAIETAKSSVEKATKPSDLLKAINSVNDSLTTANNAVKEKIDAEHNNNKKNNDHSSDPDALKEEKKKAKEEIDKIPGLTEDEKNDYKKQIDDSTHSGDPEAVVNRAKKNDKIKKALEKIKDFTHLNNAQKEAFKKIIEYTDAHNHTDADGKDLGIDDIDVALANAANTDNAMARLEELKKKANDFKNEKDGKYSKLTNSDDDQNKKKAFDGYLADATTLTKADQGDAKNADQVNELYKDLLKAMQAIDDKAKGAGVITDALQAEVDNDKALKPNATANPATKGDSVYTTASADKKEAFDKALNEAQTVLNGTKTADISDADKEAAEQKEIDAALDKLIKARLALDGVDTKPLQDEIDKDSNVKDLDKYKYADKSKTDAFDKALQDAKDLIDNLTGKKQAAQGEEDVTTKTQAEKQKLVDDALAKLKAAEAALKGKKPVEPTPTPTPTPAAVDKTDLAAELSKADTFGRYLSYLISSSDKQDAYNAALAEARRVYGDPNATQEQVNAAAAALRRAAEALRGYFWLDDGTVSPTPSPLPIPSPLPTPGAGTGNTGSGSEAGFGVNDNAPTTVDKGELNIQIDSAESDLQPGNAGNGNAGAGNAGSNNAGNSANSGASAGNAGNNNAANANANANSGSNANNVNGANSAAVNAAVESNQAVKQADAQVSKAQEAVNAALAEAKKVAADSNATQAQVDAAVQKLSDARKALATAKAHAAQVRASVRAQVLRSSKESKESASLSATGSNVSAFGLFAATLSAAGAALFATKRRGISRHSNR